jgi:hypothetical protein
MSTADDHRARAVAALAEREYERAGDAFTRAAWACLAEPREGQDPFEADENGWVGNGLASFVIAAVAYRVADRPSPATHRGVEGVAVARDLDRALDHPVQRACLDELVADCRVAGGLDDAATAYDEAAEAYEAAAETVDSPQRWGTTPLFEAAAAPLQQTARSVADGEIAIAWEDLHGPDPSDSGRFLAHRARYKRQRFPELVERVVADGHLAAPRGTTEYGNATYRCPACAATDVNWIAGQTLCLRCSTPMAER